MAISPLIQQSGTRIDQSSLRKFRQDAATKGVQGPESVQAFAEGELKAANELKAEQSRQTLNAQLERERQAEQTRQFNKQQRDAKRESEGNFAGDLLSGVFGS